MADIDVVVADLGIASAGNSVTANRYCAMLEELGHRATITSSPQSPVVVALNAYRTHAAVAALGADVTVVAVLTGTDLYRFWETDRELVLETLHRATAIVGLNEHAGRLLPAELAAKLVIIKEGAASIDANLDSPPPPPLRALVVGHLRDEKDPKALSEALDLLPAECQAMVDHYGAAHTDEWAAWGQQQTANHRRYTWHGEIPRPELDAVYQNAHVLINTSKMEGGANVVSEAVMAGLAVVATAIDGNAGVLGDSHPGLVPPGDPAALAQRILELESDAAQLKHLADASVALQGELTTHHEAAQWGLLLDRVLTD